MEGTEVARLDRGADISEGGEEGVAGERSPTGDRRLGVVMAETYLVEETQTHFKVSIMTAPSPLSYFKGCAH